jgi:hypothetical protein
MHHYLSSLIGRERQRDLMAQADRHRLARQISDLARASRPAGASRRPARARRAAVLTRLRLRYRAAR